MSVTRYPQDLPGYEPPPDETSPLTTEGLSEATVLNYARAVKIQR